MIQPFDQAAVDRRFLEEVYRLGHEGAYATYAELAQSLQSQRSIILQLESGRYHCNLKLLYLLHAHYGADIMYVLQGDGAEKRPPAPPRPFIPAGRPTKQR